MKCSIKLYVLVTKVITAILCICFAFITVGAAVLLFDKTIYDMLTDILINKVCDQMERKDFPYVTVDEQKKIHLQHIRELPPEIEYYDVMSLKYQNASLKHKAIVLICKVFGMRTAERAFRSLGK